MIDDIRYNIYISILQKNIFYMLCMSESKIKLIARNKYKKDERKNARSQHSK